MRSARDFPPALARNSLEGDVEEAQPYFTIIEFLWSRVLARDQRLAHTILPISPNPPPSRGSVAKSINLPRRVGADLSHCGVSDELPCGIFVGYPVDIDNARACSDCFATAPGLPLSTSLDWHLEFRTKPFCSFGSCFSLPNPSGVLSVPLPGSVSPGPWAFPSLF